MVLRVWFVVVKGGGNGWGSSRNLGSKKKSYWDGEDGWTKLGGDDDEEKVDCCVDEKKKSPPSPLFPTHKEIEQSVLKVTNWCKYEGYGNWNVIG